jgi:hypothetical protein
MHEELERTHFMKEEIVQQLSELKQRVEEMRGYL